MLEAGALVTPLNFLQKLTSVLGSHGQELWTSIKSVGRLFGLTKGKLSTVVMRSLAT